MSHPFLSKEDSIKVDREIVARGSFYDFVQMAWPEIEPAPFIPNWHLEEMCTVLEAVSLVLMRNLLLNIPPGSGKSIIVNVLWNGWEWIKRPHTKYIYTSYDQSLVGARDGGRLISLLQSEWYQARWGNLLLEKNPSASNFDNKAGGMRFATSPGGKGTGRHANIIVYDDPIKPLDALGGGSVEKKALRKVSDWKANTMASRMADPLTHREVIVMQRLCRGDLAGEAEAAGFTVVKFPMRFVSNLRCVTEFARDRRTKEGELLFPSRYDELAVATLEKRMGPMIAAAQLQQEPQIEGGGIFKRHYWRFWHKEPGIPEPCLQEKCFMARRCLDASHKSDRACALLPSEGLDVQSWDMSFKGTDGTDYVAAGVWRAFLAKYYLMSFFNERMGFAETKARFRVFSQQWRSAYIQIIEDKANGPAIQSELEIDFPGITMVNPLGGKEARANACSPLFAAEQVFIPHPDIEPLVWLYMWQLEGFPRDTHDDLVDMTSQVLLQFRKHGDGVAFSQAMAKLRGENVSIRSR